MPVSVEGGLRHHHRCLQGFDVVCRLWMWCGSSQPDLDDGVLPTWRETNSVSDQVGLEHGQVSLHFRDPRNFNRKLLALAVTTQKLQFFREHSQNDRIVLISLGHLKSPQVGPLNQ